MFAIVVSIITLIIFMCMLRRPIRLLQELARRVARLEASLEEMRAAAAAGQACAEAPSASPAAPVSTVEAEAAMPQTPAAAAPPITAPPPPSRQPPELSAWESPALAPEYESRHRIEEPGAPKASAMAALRTRFGAVSPEWEAIVGGSWLNKLGVVVFVIGLSLFVGYSLTELGPLGRVAVGAAVSVAMLICGTILERRPLYRLYARGLIGGGWSGLYFTAYAAHGIASARVIDNPALATGLLVAVAAGMILHSLRYRSEVVTGLAYAGAFIALAISALSNFALIALIPLAASLLFVAQRFRWYRATFAGLAVTYGSYLLITIGGPAAGAQVIRNQSTLVIYWLLFEVFDLIDSARGHSDRVVPVDHYPAALFPLNTFAFIGVSLLQWLRCSQPRLDVLMACIAGVFAVDAAVRAVIRPPKSFTPEQNAAQRVVEGGYEGAVTVAALCAAAAMFQRFAGLELEVALLLEAEILIFAGLGLREKYLAYLGALIFMACASQLLFVDLDKVSEFGTASLFGLQLHRWSLVAGLTTAAAYFNRWSIGERYAEGYSYFAAFVAAIVIPEEVAVDYLGLGWVVLGASLFEAGAAFEAADVRVQGYAAAALGALTALAVGALGWWGVTGRGQQIALACCAAIAYGLALQTTFPRPSPPPDTERVRVRDYSLYAANAFVAVLLWYLLPAPLVAVGWMLLALALIETGLSLPFPVLRRCGYAAGALAYGRLFLANFTNAGFTAGISHRLLTVTPVVLFFYWTAARLCSGEVQTTLERGERHLWRVCLHGASALVFVLIRFEAGRAFAVVGWSLMMLVLLYLGDARAERELRWQAYIVAVLVFMRAWATNFYVPGTLAGVLTVRIATASVAIAALYVAQFMSPRRAAGELPAAGIGRWLAMPERNARTMFALLATTLLTLLLYNEVSGQMLTEAWALEGVCLLIVGFVERERVLRYSGLLLLGVCVLKVFFYDLRNLETLPRILSFIVLGLLMLAVSFVYTRYYESVKRYL